MVMDSNNLCKRHEDGKLARAEGNVSCAVYRFPDSLILGHAIQASLFPQGTSVLDLNQTPIPMITDRKSVV